MKSIKNPSLPILQSAVLAAVLGVVSISPARALTFDMANLTIDPTASADLEDNSLIVRTTPFATILGYVATGYNAAAWDGFGLNTSSALTIPSGLGALGIADNSILAAPTFFGVSTPGSNEALIRFTYYGDADLNGLVDATDYAFTDAGFFGAGNHWLLGDFDYSGVVDATDYAFLDAGFFGQGAPFAPSFSAAPIKGGVVPEPGSVGLLAFGVVTFLLRRSRSI